MGGAVDKAGRVALAHGSVGRTTSPASKGKAPRTARGEKTLRKILDAALLEFGQRGFHDSSIVGITSRAKVALGTFYTYFDSKEAVFAALVRDMSRQVRDHVAPDIEGIDRRDRTRAPGTRFLPALRLRRIRKSTGSSTRPSSSILPASAPIMKPPPPASQRGSRKRRPRARCATTARSPPKYAPGRSWASTSFWGCGSECGAGRTRSWSPRTPTTCIARGLKP